MSARQMSWPYASGSVGASLSPCPRWSQVTTVRSVDSAATLCRHMPEVAPNPWLSSRPVPVPAALCTSYATRTPPRSTDCMAISVSRCSQCGKSRTAVWTGATPLAAEQEHRQHHGRVADERDQQSALPRTAGRLGDDRGEDQHDE